jgi:hypothetical protein
VTGRPLTAGRNEHTPGAGYDHDSPVATRGWGIVLTFTPAQHGE